MSGTKERCCERVHDGGRWPSFHQCMHKAVCEEGGKHYCGIHNPAKVRERMAKSNEKWNKDCDKRRMERAAPELYEALKAILDHVEDMNVERVSSQCTLCHTFRMMGHAALAAADGKTEAA